MRRRPRAALLLAAVAVTVAWSVASGGFAHATAVRPERFPAAGEVLHAVTVRERPDPAAGVVRRLRRFRPDGQFAIVLALSVRRGADGAWWYRLSLAGPPNGGRGWVPANGVEVRPVVNRIVVRLASRRLEVRRVRDGKVLLRSVVAVGAPGTETPRGREFYVESAFVPTDPFYGAFALETSAYARVSDWPGDVVGIHGTNRPELLGRAVSHGCVRVANDVAARLRLLAPLGTPVDVLP